MYRIWEIIGKIIFFVYLLTREKISEAKNAKITLKIPEYKCARANKIATEKILIVSLTLQLEIFLLYFIFIRFNTLLMEKYKYIRYNISS